MFSKGGFKCFNGGFGVLSRLGKNLENSFLCKERQKLTQ
jgi:hypothetical protein